MLLLYDERLPTRFWAKTSVVNKGFSSPCWVWVACLHATGYGWFYWQGGPKLAHRVSYTALQGVVPDGLDLDHLCRVRSCVNPGHLEPVTRSENLRRGVTGLHNKNKTQCHRGHPFSETNTYVCAEGKRHCRVCRMHRDHIRRPKKVKAVL